MLGRDVILYAVKETERIDNKIGEMGCYLAVKKGRVKSRLSFVVHVERS